MIVQRIIKERDDHDPRGDDGYQAERNAELTRLEEAKRNENPEEPEEEEKRGTVEITDIDTSDEGERQVEAPEARMERLGITPSGQTPTPEERSLADKIGGFASVKISGQGGREFDAVSEQYVAQTTDSKNAVRKPGNYLSRNRRNQIKATIKAAKDTGRGAYFEFTAGSPHPKVTRYIKDQAARQGVEVVIDGD